MRTPYLDYIHSHVDVKNPQPRQWVVACKKISQGVNIVNFKDLFALQELLTNSKGGHTNTINENEYRALQRFYRYVRSYQWFLVGDVGETVTINGVQYIVNRETIQRTMAAITKRFLCLYENATMAPRKK